MDELNVYVVRVYRKDETGIAGIIEAVSSGEQLPFRTTEQLWRALRDLPSPRHGFQQSQSTQEAKK